MGTRDDDEDDPGFIANVKYPCMPSLVALQQMRNRLHLAHLGKKLMKWSALASGREIRRVGQLLLDAYDGFAEECADANMLLARCRFHLPDLNEIVLENTQKEAALTVTSSTKTAGGVKMKTFEILEKEPAPVAYPHLGLGAGGQIIKETKLAWAALLKKLTWILELREAFMDLDYAFKSSTKKENVLGKLIIPRLNMTIHYIIQEIEELRREELFRIKKVVQYKARAKEKTKKPSKILEPEFEPEIKPNVVIRIPEKSVVKTPPMVEQPKVVVLPKALPPTELPPKVQPPKVRPPKLPPLKCQKCVSPKKPLAIPKTCRDCVTSIPASCAKCIKSEVEKPSASEKLSVSENSQIPSAQSSSELYRTEDIQQKLDEVLKLGKGIVDKGHFQYAAFIKSCEELRNKFSKINKKRDTDVDTLRRLASNVRNLINTTNNFKNNLQSKSSECLFSKWTEVQNNLMSFIRGAEVIYTQDNLNAITANINELKLLARQLQTIDTAQSENPSKNVKIESNETSASVSRNSCNDKYESKDISEHKRSTSTEKFLNACVDFKTKIEEFRGNPPKAETELCELIKQLDQAIALSSIAKKSGLISKNVDQFIGSCENLKQRLLNPDEIKQKKGLAPNPSEMSETLETFLNTCKSTEEHIEKSISIITQPSSVCSQDKVIKKDKSTHGKIFDYIRGCSLGSINVCQPAASFETEKKPFDKKEEQPKDPKLKSCIPKMSRSPTIISDKSEKTKPKSKVLKSSSSIESARSHEKLQKIVVSRESLKTKDSRATNFSSDGSVLPTSDSNAVPEEDGLGAFDNKVKKVVKIKRVLNDDGTVSEQVDTLTVKVDMHDPDKFSLGNDDLNFSDDYNNSMSSSEKPTPSPSSGNTDKNQKGSSDKEESNNKDGNYDIRHCTIADQTNLASFNPLRKAFSEVPFAVAQKIPFLRNSISEILFNKSKFFFVAESQCT